MKNCWLLGKKGLDLEQQQLTWLSDLSVFFNEISVLAECIFV